MNTKFPLPAFFLTALITPGLMGIHTTAQGQDDPTGPPNFLLFIGDDMGIETLKCHEVGEYTAHTPNLDEICASGMRFDNFWTQPVCSPTRAALLTGQFGFRNGVGTPVNGPTGIDWGLPDEPVANEDIDINGGMAMGMGVVTGQTTPGGNRPSIAPDAFSMMHALKGDRNKNYATAALGKWHLANDANGGLDHPKRVGFDYYAGSMRAGGPASYYAWSKVINGGDPFLETKYATTDAVDEGIAWLKTRDNDPWFLWVAFNAPHGPLEPPPADLLSGKTRQSLATGNNHAVYNAMIEAMDTEIGRLLKSMDEQTRANTYIIFIGDNGTSNNVAMPPYDGGRAKGNVYQGGVRVPFFIAGPGIRGGQVSHAMANSVDVFATVLELAGIRLEQVKPANVIQDTVSLVPILSGRKDIVRDFNYADHFGSTRNGESNERAIRNARYKLVQDFINEREEFFDLVNDPYEKSDLLQSELSFDARENYTRLKARIESLVKTD